MQIMAFIEKKLERKRSIEIKFKYQKLFFVNYSALYVFIIYTEIPKFHYMKK